MANKTMANEIESKNDVFHQEIIDTFFGKVERHDINTKIIPVESQKPQKKPKNLYLSSIMLVLSLIFFATGLLYFISAKVSFNFPYLPFNVSLNYTKIFSSGSINYDNVESLAFDGDAKAKSIMQGDCIKMVNSGTIGSAKVKFKFKSTMDFSKLNLLFMIRSEPGPRAATLALTDTLGNTRRAAIKISPSWEMKNMTFSDKNYFDLKKVSSVSIEFGTSTIGNSQGTEIYIKEIGVRRADD